MKTRWMIIVSLVGMMLLGGCGSKIVEQAEEPKVTEQIEVSEPAEVTEPLGEIAYEELTQAQLEIFESVGAIGVEDIKSYAITMDFMETNQDDLIKGYIEMNKLPSNGVALFQEWKAKTDYYSQFEKDILTDNMRNENGTSILDEQKPDVQTPSENNNNNQKPVTPPVTPDPGEYTPPVTPNKPVKTPEQIEQQKPSNNNDSGIPLTPEEIREAFEGMTDGSDGSSTFDDSTHGYDVEGW